VICVCLPPSSLLSVGGHGQDTTASIRFHCLSLSGNFQECSVQDFKFDARVARVSAHDPLKLFLQKVGVTSVT